MNALNALSPSLKKLNCGSVFSTYAGPMESSTPSWLKGAKIPGWQRREDLFVMPAGGWLLMAAVLLSIILAGGRPLWAQGIVGACIGLLWVFHTPTKLPAKSVTIMLLVLALVPLVAYLPAAWMEMPLWRRPLRGSSEIAWSRFVTPQPWLTLHCYLLWITGLALAGWCACRDWDHYNRGTLARVYAAGMLLVALFAIFGKATGYQPSWWVSTDGFGPFMNRNQWGAALGFAGVVAIALVHQSIRQEHKQGAVFWLITAIIFAGSVIYNGSRGGLIVLAGGGFAYWGFYGLIRREYRYAAIGISFLLISFALFAMGGGDLLERFVGLRSLVEGQAGDDVRLQFYRMTMSMVAGYPLTGFGLGNFEYVFPFYLDYEPLFDRRPLHPESSWLWLASEGGWLSLVAVVLSILILIMHAYAARKSRAATIRSVGLACAVMLAVNAGFEVSAHRLGTLFPVILLASLALPQPDGAKTTPFFRAAAKIFGVIIAAVGLLWTVGGFGFAAFPSVQGTEPLQRQAEAAKSAGQIDRAVEMLETCKPLRPLDWNIHWTLSEWLMEKRDLEPAWREFLAANTLLPYLSWTIRERATRWMAVSPGRATSAVLEAMARAPAAKRAEIYGDFLRKSSTNRPLHSLLLNLFPNDTAFELARIREASPEVARKRLARLVQRTDNLASVREELAVATLQSMLQNEMLTEIDAVLAENPRLKRAGWEVLMNREIRRQNAREALEIYFSYGPRPAIPALLSRSDLRSVERAAALAPLDISTAIAYYQALSGAQRETDAMQQLRRIMELPQAPPYIWFLAAQSSHRRGDDDEAWSYLTAYRQKTGK